MAIVDNNVTEIITKDKSLVPILFWENRKYCNCGRCTANSN